MFHSVLTTDLLFIRQWMQSQQSAEIICGYIYIAATDNRDGNILPAPLHQHLEADKQ
jgi:hypothetical protein